MKIEFKIKEIPKTDQEKYFVAYLSGELIITFDNTVFFKEQDILLVEFAIRISKWLMKVKSGKYEDFVYETMDHDEPIICMDYVHPNRFKINSIWQQQTICSLQRGEEIILGFEEFIDNLRRELLIKNNVDLDSFIK